MIEDLFIEGVNGGSHTKAILPCLRIIKFNDNPIFSIEENFFVALRESNLQELSFQNTKLEYIHLCEYFSQKRLFDYFLSFLDAFKYLYNLKHLDLFNNHKLLSKLRMSRKSIYRDCESNKL